MGGNRTCFVHSSLCVIACSAMIAHAQNSALAENVGSYVSKLTAVCHMQACCVSIRCHVGRWKPHLFTIYIIIIKRLYGLEWLDNTESNGMDVKRNGGSCISFTEGNCQNRVCVPAEPTYSVYYYYNTTTTTTTTTSSSSSSSSSSSTMLSFKFIQNCK